MAGEQFTPEEIAKGARYALAELDRLKKVSTSGHDPETAAQITEEIRFEVAMFHPLRAMMQSLADGTFDAAEYGYALASMVCHGAGHKARLLTEQSETAGDDVTPKVAQAEEEVRQRAAMVKALDGVDTSNISELVNVLLNAGFGSRNSAWDEGHHAGVYNATGDYDEPLRDNPYPKMSES